MTCSGTVRQSRGGGAIMPRMCGLFAALTDIPCKSHRGAAFLRTDSRLD
jgi:hypothetical protein